MKINDISINLEYIYINFNFLLDISHAKITAQYHGFDVYDYISKLPLDRIVEIHVNGSGFDKDGFPADTHESMGYSILPKNEENLVRKKSYKRSNLRFF